MENSRVEGKDRGRITQLIRDYLRSKARVDAALAAAKSADVVLSESRDALKNASHAVYAYCPQGAYVVERSVIVVDHDGVGEGVAMLPRTDVDAG